MITEEKKASPDARGRWLNRLAERTRKPYGDTFNRWLKWMTDNGGDFSHATVEELIIYQRAATGDDAYRILNLLQTWIDGMDLRFRTKKLSYTVVRSFFDHSRASLPVDKGYRIRSETPRVKGRLDPSKIRDVVLKSNRTYRAALLSIYMAGLDLNGFTYWSENGLEELRAGLRREDAIIPVMIPGRKGSQFKENFTTWLGGDALRAVREYMDHRPEIVAGAKSRAERRGESYAEPTSIFLDQFGNPLSPGGLRQYFQRSMIEIGEVKLKKNKNSGNRYGLNPHELRDCFRTQWQMSGADPSIAEAAMGHIHAVDPSEYNKSWQNDAYVREQFRRALPYLNILSSPRAFGLEKAEEIIKQDERVAELERQLEVTKNISKDEVGGLRKQLLESEKTRAAEIQRVKADMRIEMRKMLIDLFAGKSPDARDVLELISLGMSPEQAKAELKRQDTEVAEALKKEDEKK